MGHQYIECSALYVDLKDINLIWSKYIILEEMVGLIIFIKNIMLINIFFILFMLKIKS